MKTTHHKKVHQTRLRRWPSRCGEQRLVSPAPGLPLLAAAAAMHRRPGGGSDRLQLRKRRPTAAWTSRYTAAVESPAAGSRAVPPSASIAGQAILIEAFGVTGRVSIVSVPRSRGSPLKRAPQHVNLCWGEASRTE